MGFFDAVPLVPPDPILGLSQAFAEDSRREKVNLGVGLYKDEELKTPILRSVQEAERQLIGHEVNKEYLAISGEPSYLEEMGQLVFEKKGWGSSKERIAAFQTLGGTGALKLGGTFLSEEIKTPLYLSSPTWPNHRGVFTHCSLAVDTYPYYDLKKHQVDVQGMLSCLESLSPRSVVVLHGCCHNPTGADLTPAEWQQLATLCVRKQLLPFFDLAYQGLGVGLDEDAAPIRMFLKQGLEMLVAVSNSKNLSLYSERVGCLFIVAKDSHRKEALLSRGKQMIRTNYSNPPSHGAKVALLVLRDPKLRALWETELCQMRQRLISMRTLLADKLKLSHVQGGQGMFAFLGLNASDVEHLRSQYGIYMTSDGRINVCGLNDRNIDYVVEAIRSLHA
jgi:aspartate/tyrosine/aromatic aminotransferase